MFEEFYGIEEVEPELSHARTKAFGRTYETFSKVVSNKEGKLFLQLTDKQPGSKNTLHLPYEEPFLGHFRKGLYDFLSTQEHQKNRIPINLPLRVIMTPLLLGFGARMKCGIPSLSIDLSSSDRIVGILTMIGKRKFLMLRFKSKHHHSNGVFSEDAISDLIEKRLTYEVDPVDGINSVTLEVGRKGERE